MPSHFYALTDLDRPTRWCIPNLQRGDMYLNRYIVTY